MKLNNLEHSGNYIDTSELLEVLWTNDGSVNDFSFVKVSGKPITFTDEFSDKMLTAWNFLFERAKEHNFNLTNNPALQLEELDISNRELKISKNVDYKTIVSIRSQEELYSQLDVTPRPNALVIVSMLVSSDNKLVLGKRDFYGDWEVGTYESPGAFLSYADLEGVSAIKSATNKISSDFEQEVTVNVKPFAIYNFPRILETVIVCVAKINSTAESLSAKKYADILIFENTKESLREVIEMPFEKFHPPSRTALQYYYENFDDAQKILKEL